MCGMVRMHRLGRSGTLWLPPGSSPGPRDTMADTCRRPGSVHDRPGANMSQSPTSGASDDASVDHQLESLLSRIRSITGGDAGPHGDGAGTPTAGGSGSLGGGGTASGGGPNFTPGNPPPSSATPPGGEGGGPPRGPAPLGKQQPRPAAGATPVARPPSDPLTGAALKR